VDRPSNPPRDGQESSGNFPHLDRRLYVLSGDALSFWGDPVERARMIGEIGHVWGLTQRGRPRAGPLAPSRLRQVVASVDVAVDRGLAALHLPRRSVRPHVVAIRGVYGEKFATCDLRISARHVIRDTPDEVAGTWVHESLHARAPRATTWGATTSKRGYEEGMAEGLSLIIRRSAGWDEGINAYPGYIRAYEWLAASLGIPDEELYRRLWQLADIPALFVREIDRIVNEIRGHGLTSVRRRRLREVADDLFDLSRGSAVYNPEVDADLDQAWGSALT
jgi:hypothetical protein